MKKNHYIVLVEAGFQGFQRLCYPPEDKNMPFWLVLALSKVAKDLKLLQLMT